MYGYQGRIALIDVMTGGVQDLQVSNDERRKFIGGRGLASKLLMDLLPRGADPLGPDNVVIFAVGPLNGTLIPASSRWSVAAKSPLTGYLGSGNAGGQWGPELKWAGFDAVAIKGASEKPCFIYLHDGEVDVLPGEEVWGKTTWEAEEIIRDMLGDPGVKVVSIGKAGEKPRPHCHRHRRQDSRGRARRYGRGIGEQERQGDRGERTRGSQSPRPRRTLRLGPRDALVRFERTRVRDLLQVRFDHRPCRKVREDRRHTCVQLPARGLPTFEGRRPRGAVFQVQPHSEKLCKLPNSLLAHLRGATWKIRRHHRGGRTGLDPLGVRVQMWDWRLRLCAHRADARGPVRASPFPPKPSSPSPWSAGRGACSIRETWI